MQMRILAIKKIIVKPTSRESKGLQTAHIARIHFSVLWCLQTRLLRAVWAQQRAPVLFAVSYWEAILLIGVFVVFFFLKDQLMFISKREKKEL